MTETTPSSTVTQSYPNNLDSDNLIDINFSPLSDTKINSSFVNKNSIGTYTQGSASTLQTRAVASQNRMFNEYPPTHMPDSMKMDTTPWVRRPFFVGTVSWPSTAARFSSLTLPISRLPRDVFNSNPSLQAIVKNAALYRMKMCLNISCTGTLVHQGTLIAAVVPPMNSNTVNFSSDGGRRINTMLSGPHAFIAANEASSVCIEVPFYCNSDLDILDTSPFTGNWNVSGNGVPPSHVANLGIVVLNPLVPSTGASTTLTLVIEAVFEELELYVPSPKLVGWTTAPPTTFEGQSFFATAATKMADHTSSYAKSVTSDFIDAIRGTFRLYTGLHNSNMAYLSNKEVMSQRNYINVVDSSTAFEKLDPSSKIDRITDSPIFNTTRDEMLIKSIVSKPQYLGTFNVSTTTNTGALLWCRPICPWQGGNSGGLQMSNNIETLYNFTRAWKGDLTLYIQSSCTNKHSLKLKVIKYYFPPSVAANSFPLMNSLLSAPSDLLEYSGGNQINSVSLPYMARNNLIYNSRENSAPGLIHGMYYIYLAQPLVIGDQIPTNIEFNVYMKCDDNFQYFGYSTEMGRVLPVGIPIVADPKPEPVPPLVRVNRGESAEVMNAPTDQRNILNNSEKETELYSNRLVPLIDVRPLIRRIQKGLVLEMTNSATGSSCATVDLSPLIAENYDTYYRGSNGVIPAMFYGKNCGLKFKIKASPAARMTVQYVPPNVGVIPTNSGFNNVIYRTVPNPLLVDNFVDYTSTATFPLPTQEFPTAWHSSGLSNQELFEFTIPNTSIYKFIGGPNKMLELPSSTVLSVADLGQLVISIVGDAAAKTQVAIYYGMTDESRLGFQVIAPTILRPVGTFGPINGTLITPNQTATSSNTPTPTPTPKMYFSTLTTAYS